MLSVAREESSARRGAGAPYEFVKGDGWHSSSAGVEIRERRDLPDGLGPVRMAE
jgi:hypothetical protein